MPSTIELDQSDPLVGEVDRDAVCISACDLLGDDRRKLAAAVRSACEETGFFFIDLAAPERDTLAATLSYMRRFFSLDDQDPIKQNARLDEREVGWVPKYSEPAYQPGTVSHLEGFDFGLCEVRDPQAALWPVLPGFRAAAVRCWREFLVLGDAVLETLARAFEMEPGFLVDRCSSRALNSMRLLHYDGEVARNGGADVGISAHTDFECITLIYQTAPGLELRDVDGRWLDAPARDGRVVVLLDDMLERWTNGLIKATGHRVRGTEERRFSIVMFFAANEGMDIAPLPQFVSPSRPSRYPPITQARHIENELTRSKQNAAAN